MIAGIFHAGSGLGDQLFRYVTVRTLAEKKGYEWGMLAQGEDFKGDFFSGGSDTFYHENPVAKGWPNGFSFWNEKEVCDSTGYDIRSYDPEINFVQDNTVIDGSFEDSKYWEHNLANIDKWLTVEPLMVDSRNLCVIGFRGGEYALYPELFLPKEYYSKAIERMLAINPEMQFQVHTDDPELAKQYFPDYEIVANTPISHSKHTNMGFNWRSARFVRYAIIPNSAFFIMPRMLAHFNDPTAITIAPRYWARHNTKEWARPACYYSQFTYVHAEDTN